MATAGIRSDKQSAALARLDAVKDSVMNASRMAERTGAPSPLTDMKSASDMLDIMTAAGTTRYLAEHKPIQDSSSEGGGDHWHCGLCHQYLSSVLRLDIHVCKQHVELPVGCTPTRDDGRCAMCRTLVPKDESKTHKCVSLFVRTCVLDWGGLSTKDSPEVFTSIAADLAASPKLKEGALFLRSLNARFIAAIEVNPGAPLQFTMGWVARSRLPLDQQGIHVIDGKYLVYWGPKKPTEEAEESDDDGAAWLSDLQWKKGSKELIIRGYPYGGIATKANHSCSPTATVRHTEAEGQNCKVPVALLVLRRRASADAPVELTYDYRATTNVKSEERPCRCCVGCPNMFISYQLD